MEICTKNVTFDTGGNESVKKWYSISWPRKDYIFVVVQYCTECFLNLSLDISSGFYMCSYAHPVLSYFVGVNILLCPAYVKPCLTSQII
jgi:hypothetical protein